MSKKLMDEGFCVVAAGAVQRRKEIDVKGLKEVGQSVGEQIMESKEEVLRKRSKVLEHARSQKFHYLLPISVQQALKNVILQHAHNELQKSIMINEVIERAVHEYPEYFRAGSY